MKKRLLSALLCLCMVVCMMPTVSLAANETSGSCGKDGDNVTWSLSDDGTLIISGTGEMKKYENSTYIPWKDIRQNIKTVVIENGVTNIANSAFYSCSSLTSVEIPNSVTSIGNYAFTSCSNLVSAEIPNSITSIGDYAFYKCSSLSSVKIPNSVTSIGKNVFEDCSKLTDIAVDEQNKNYSSEDGVLFDKNKTELIFYPIGKTDKSYNIPNSVTSISSRAFRSCLSLSSVTIPTSVTSIGASAFSSCSNLASVTIPDSVTSIGEYAFGSCSNLASVEIPNSVTSMGGYVFSNCSNLTSVTIPNSVTKINACVFYGCSNLVSVTIPDTVTSIGMSAFLGCSNLASVTIPDTVTSIGSFAFRNCLKLTSVTIPSSVTSMGESVFSFCEKLTSVTILSGITSISDYTFYKCSQLSSVEIPNSVTSIENSVFSGCSNLTSVTIPDSVTSIGNYAFLDCKSLTNLTIPESVVQVGKNAFGTYYDSSSKTYKPMDGFIANVKPGSAAETYCTTNNIQFENEHTEEAVAAKEATCAEDGNTAGKRCSNCGAILEGLETIKATGEHTWDAGEVTKEATCTATGVKTYTCTVCGETKTEDIAKIDHTLVTDAAVEPTCTKAGKTEGSHCEVCGEVIKAQTEIPATGEHTWDTGKVTKEATCTATGVKTYTCTVCGATKTEDIAKIDHTPVTDAAVEPTYTTEGKTEGSHCSVCGEIIKAQETIPALEKPEPTPTISFTDVDANEYYAAPVQWAVERGITNGMGNGKFEPNTTCTRGQIVTFLWRANGEPEPTSTNNPFTDVDTGEYYGKAVLWAVEQGITTGTSATTFSPNQGCTRGQVATFLWRAEGKPSSSVSNQFSDVDTSEYYGTAVLWASEKGITNGMGDGTFAPNATCTRGQIVTFLYRAMA